MQKIEQINVHTAPSATLAKLTDAEIFRAWMSGGLHPGAGTKPVGANRRKANKR